MSGIVGLSNKEIGALADASYALDQLARLTDVERHSETSEIITGILKRVSQRWGSASDRSNSNTMMALLAEMLPPEDEE